MTLDDRELSARRSDTVRSALEEWRDRGKHRGRSTMLTIARITASPTNVSALQEVIGAFDTRRASGELEWRTRRNDGYVLDLCRGESWREHVAAIAHFVEDNSDALASALSVGANLVVDVAVWSEDVQDMYLRELWLPPEVLSALASVSVPIIFSLYCTKGAPGSAGSLWKAPLRRWNRVRRPALRRVHKFS